MNIPVLLLSVLWSCFALSLVALVPLGYGLYRIVDDMEDEWPQLASFSIGQLVVMALMTCSLVFLGHSTSALWVWRSLSAISSILSALLCFPRIFRASRGRSSGPGGAVLLCGAVAVNIFFFVCSVAVRALPYVGTFVPFRVEPAPSFLAQLSFWHAALYVILAVASVISGLLFITSSRSDGPLSFERTGGGLGAGSGGWEVSNSLTYLIATIALGALLLVLIFHNDAMDQEKEKRQEDATHKVSLATDVATPPGIAAHKTDSGRTAAAGPEAHAAGAELNGH